MATIAALIVEVAANTANIDKATRQINTQLDSIGGAATKLGGMLAASFSVGALVSFGKALIADADALVRLSDTTGVSIEGLQRLQSVGDGAGNSVDDITSAIVKLEDKVAGGDKSADQALKKMGMSLRDLQGMGPEQQFIAISDAIRQIEDPAQQVNIAIDLFGKAGAQILPTLKAGFDDVRDSAVGMSKDTAQALDEAGDTIDRWWRRTKGVSAEAVVMLGRLAKSGFQPLVYSANEAARETRQFTDDLEKLTRAASGPALFKQAPTTQFPVPDDAEIKRFNDSIDESIAKQKKAAAAAKEHATALGEFNQLGKDITQTALGYESTVNTLDGAVVEAIKYYREQGVAMGQLQKWYGISIVQSSALEESLDAEFAAWRRTVGGTQIYAQSLQKVVDLRRATGGVLDVPRDVPSIPPIPVGGNPFKQGSPFVREMGASLKGFFQKDFGGIIVGALQGGGNVMRSAGAGIGNALGSSLLGSAGAGGLGDFLTKNLGKTLGGALGSVIPGLGTIVGSLGGKLLDKLFGNPEKQVNPIREAFVQVNGGLSTLDRKAHDAGVTLDRLLDARTPEAYKTAIDELNAAFAFQDRAMQTLDETVKKYNFTNEQIGPTLQRQQLGKTFEELFQDYQVLHAGGLDQVAVTQQMSQSVSQYVQDAKRMGIEIPAAMRPMLENFAQNGDLLDENGAAITDLSAYGVTWAESMTESVAKIVTSIQQLVDAIDRGLGAAIRNIPAPVVRGRVEWDVDPITGLPRDFNATVDPIPQATGGDWWVTKPTLFLAGEAGPERATFTPSGKSRGGGGSTVVDFSGVQAEVVALRRQQAEMNGYMQSTFARDIARAVMAARATA